MKSGEAPVAATVSPGGKGGRERNLLLAPTLVAALSKEVEQGLTSDFFYHRYRGQAYNMRAWMHSTLTRLSNSGYEIAGYGAAAKGVVLLHYLLSFPRRTWEILLLWMKAGINKARTVRVQSFLWFLNLRF